jgi:hypothetical protein
MLPDFLAFRINTARLSFNRTSVDIELEALLSAVLLLQYERAVPTTFYTDCDGIPRAIREKTELGATPNSRRAYLLNTLRRYFPQNGCWKIKWVHGAQNRLADELSRQREGDFVRSIPLSEHEFYYLNGNGPPKKRKRRNFSQTLPPARIIEPTKPTNRLSPMASEPAPVIKKKAVKPEGISNVDYLRSSLWAPARYEQIFACG